MDIFTSVCFAKHIKFPSYTYVSRWMNNTIFIPCTAIDMDHVRVRHNPRTWKLKSNFQIHYLFCISMASFFLFSQAQMQKLDKSMQKQKFLHHLPWNMKFESLALQFTHRVAKNYQSLMSAVEGVISCLKTYWFWRDTIRLQFYTRVSQIWPPLATNPPIELVGGGDLNTNIWAP